MRTTCRILATAAGIGLWCAQPGALAQSIGVTDQTDQQRVAPGVGGTQPYPSQQVQDRIAPRVDQQVTSSPYDRFEPDTIGTSNSIQTGNSTRTDADSDLSLVRRSVEESYAAPETRRRPPKPSEFEKFVSELAGRTIRRFGSELLIPTARDFISPPTTAVPPDYRINPGDQLILGLTGAVQMNNLRLVVDPDGQIFVPSVGAVRVAGIPYRDLQGAIASKVSRQYRDFNISVSIGRLHAITVYVTGFATTPGSYTMSSLSTLINAVLTAGGPAAGGSFRSIQVRRGGKLVSDFDLYDFLLKGDKRGDIVLQNGDVLFIAPAGTQVAVLGSVNHEAIFEAGVNDTLNDVLLYAGGANTVADLSQLYVLDPKDDRGWRRLSPDVALSQRAERAEILRVLPSVGIAQPLQRLQSLVTISGEVEKPGRYFVPPGTTLDQVLAMAGGLTPQAYPFGSVFVRENLRRRQQESFDKAVDELKVTLTAEPLVSAYAREGDMRARLMAVNTLVDQLRARRIDGRLVLESPVGARSIPGGFMVENNDTLYVPPQPLMVGVYGMVNGAADFRYGQGMRVRDYLAMAGGFSRLADKSHVFVVRANGTTMSGSRVRSALALPGDLIFVPIDSNRGALWARLRDITSTLFSGVAAAASIKVLSQ